MALPRVLFKYCFENIGDGINEYSLKANWICCCLDNPGYTNTWWRHQMETASALLALCAGNSPVTAHKCQWRGALMLSLICARINGWLNNREAGDLRRHRAHYDVTAITCRFLERWVLGIGALFVNVNTRNDKMYGNSAHFQLLKCIVGNDYILCGWK